MPSLEDSSAPEVPSQEEEADTHTHTHPEGGGQPGFVVRAVCLAPGGACGTPRAQEAGAVRGGTYMQVVGCALIVQKYIS